MVIIQVDEQEVTIERLVKYLSLLVEASLARQELSAIERWREGIQKGMAIFKANARTNVTRRQSMPLPPYRSIPQQSEPQLGGWSASPPGPIFGRNGRRSY